jgi:L-iditol 2-dehydrogenase
LLTWPERLTYPLPDTLSDVEGALLEPLGVALHALDLGRVQPGTSAGVFGCGPIGLLLVQALRAAGVTAILATDVLPHRVEAAAAMGATHAFHAEEALVERVFERLPGGLGVDVAFEVAGENAAVADAIAATRPGGRVILLGIPDGDRTSFSASAARRKGLTLLLSRRMAPGDLPRAIRLVESGRVELVPLLTERCALSEWRNAFGALVERRGLKVVIEPQRVSEEET